MQRGREEKSKYPEDHHFFTHWCFRSDEFLFRTGVQHGLYLQIVHVCQCDVLAHVPYYQCCMYDCCNRVRQGTVAGGRRGVMECVQAIPQAGSIFSPLISLTWQVCNVSHTLFGATCISKACVWNLSTIYILRHTLCSDGDWRVCAVWLQSFLYVFLAAIESLAEWA